MKLDTFEKWWIGIVTIVILTLVGIAVHTCATKPEDYVHFEGSAADLCKQICKCQKAEKEDGI